MSRYINWNDVVDRYRSVSDKDATVVGSSFIPFAETEVDGRLAAKYSTPFSSNNLTVKDLCIDLVYIKVGNLNIKETEKLQAQVNSKVARLLNGEEIMITSSGDQIVPGVSGGLWSSTGSYHPVFGMGDVTDFVVDSSRLVDEENARL